MDTCTDEGCCREHAEHIARLQRQIDALYTGLVRTGYFPTHPDYLAYKEALND